MGLAISGMHFAGMQAASFGMHEHSLLRQAASVDQGKLALAVAAVAFFILLSATIAAMFDRRFAALATREALALKRSEEMFRLLYRRTPLPLHALDQDGRIEDVSDAWLSLLGYDRNDVIGRPLLNFMTEESARQRVKDWQPLLREGELHDKEYRLVTRDGRFIDVLSTSRVERDASGEFLQTVGGLVDVTARRQAEEALRQAQKMEAVGQLTGGVAHDFNNILAIILGNLEMLRRRLAHQEQALRMIDNAIEGARRGAALTQRMLSFARRQSLNPRAIDFQRLVDGMRDLLERPLGPRIQLTVDLPKHLPLIHADPHQLEMALLNLVVNARDAMAEGEIIIKSDPAKQALSRNSDARLLCISVIDTGQGMDEATFARAKEPFFTTKGVGQGTGLGLSMVSGFIEQSGGRVEIKSQKGMGTAVDLWLPLATELTPSAEIPNLKTSSNALAGIKTLIVDDEPLLLVSTEAMLQEAGAVVYTAKSALEALEMLRRNPTISCLITDYAMPGMTGTQLAAAARVKNPDMLIIIATGYNEFPEETTNYPRLQKPFEGATLVQMVASNIRQPGADVIPLRPAK